MNYILLTGATGHIGGSLLRELIGRNQPVAVIARDRNGVSADQRIADLLDNMETSDASLATVCLSGDTNEPGFGLSSRDRQWVRQNCATLLHCAARVEFSGQRTGATWQANVSSAKHTVDFCREQKIEHLAYVSTAYVCGNYPDVFYEDQLEVGQTFRNEYEESKLESEKILRSSFAVEDLTVLRPAIVVGDSDTGETISYHNFYRYAQFTEMYAKASEKDEQGRWSHNVRLVASANNRLNLVAVDWVSAAMAQAVLDGRGATYHLTPGIPTLLCEIEAALKEYFCYDGVQFTENGVELIDPTPDEVRFYEYVRDYSDYWENDPLFDRTNTDQIAGTIDEPRIDVECLIRMIDFAVKDKFGRRSQRSKQRTKRRTEQREVAAVPFKTPIQ